MTTRPIVLIHGLWMTPRSFEHWAERYRRAGHEVLAPSWPGLEGEVEALRKDPSPIAKLTIAEIVAHYDGIIRGLDVAPIIMGHSFGGAFAQVLASRKLGAAVVAIDSAAVKGVTKLPWSTLRTGWPILKNPANKHRAVSLTLEQFHYRFTNHLTVEQSRPLYERYCIAGTGHVLFEGAMANFSGRAATKVDFRTDDRPPLLFVAGGIDHVSPPSLNKSNHRKYRHSHATADYREFPNRSHFTLGQDGWEDVADYALEWALAHASEVGRFAGARRLIATDRVNGVSA